MCRVYTKAYPAPSVDVGAITRYARSTELTPESRKLCDECLSLCLINTVYRVCYSEFPLIFDGDKLYIGDIATKSQDLRGRLDGCYAAVVFAATVGMEYDRLIRAYGKLDAAKAFMLQAIGTERVEALCDVFCKELKDNKSDLGEEVTDRFSPGYGDLPLELQRNIFDMLDCERHIGVFLNNSLLMTPSKSVTAIIGIKKHIL